MRRAFHTRQPPSWIQLQAVVLSDNAHQTWIKGSTSLKIYKADLHIHTCLSPCSEWEMSPKRIVEICEKKQMDMIAVCDHNSVENAGAVMRAGNQKGICVLPGMEVCSKEEVHILTIFKELDHADDMQTYVYNHLQGENNPELFGYQIVALETDEVVCENPKMLISATQLGIDEIIEKAHSLNGLCIASHVDRTMFGIIGQLGFIPPDLPLDAIEISSKMTIDEAKTRIPGISQLSIIQSSDAHSPENIGKSYSNLRIKAPTFDELCLAIKGEKGRKVEN